MKVEITDNGRSMTTTVKDCKKELEVAILQGRDFFIYERWSKRKTTAGEALNFIQVFNTGAATCQSSKMLSSEVFWTFYFAFDTYITFISTPPGVLKEKHELLEATENATQANESAPARKMRL